MTTGRTTLNNWRAYVDGYDMSGMTRSFGPLECIFDEGVDDAISYTVKGIYPGQATVKMGTLNGIFNNTATTGLHAVMEGGNGTVRDVLLACGIQAAPANNNPCFAGQFEQIGYNSNDSEPIMTVSIPFGNTSASAGYMNYAKPWGVLLHYLSAATAASTATGLDQAAQTTKGGWMMYQVTAGNGTATIKVQDADTNENASFGDLLSSGVITCEAGVSGVVALAPTATVERYVRWQIALGDATTVTFALAFMRGTI